MILVIGEIAEEIHYCSLDSHLTCTNDVVHLGFYLFFCFLFSVFKCTIGGGCLSG